MIKQYAFYFDSSSCSGCKACQVACKDKHNLRVGLLWRRVYEVTGGGWTRHGQAWTSDVFAYNVSLACNHCEKPICAEVCPTVAITKRPDGIVLIDPDKCIGCSYCSWACPYGAPQYDAETGHMTKCTFCADNLDAGLPPSCVAACPLRALDFGDRAELEARYGDHPEPSRRVHPEPSRRVHPELSRRDHPEPSRRSIYPLPDAQLTQPALLVTAHKDADRATDESARVANWEEVKGEPE